MPHSSWLRALFELFLNQKKYKNVKIRKLIFNYKCKSNKVYEKTLSERGEDMNAPALILNIFAWIIILILIRRIYVKQEFRPKVWKMVVVVFVGLFSFSINLPFMDQQIKIAILPLGVWILYGIYSKKNEGKRDRKSVV